MAVLAISLLVFAFFVVLVVGVWWISQTDRTVREHPYASLGVAFCSGLLLGVLLARGRD